MEELIVNGNKIFLPELKGFRPWDAADEYLLNEELKGTTIVINDQFGSLTAGFKASYSLSYSYINSKNIKITLGKNGLESKIIHEAGSLPDNADNIVLKLPKSLEELRFYLELISKKYPGARFYAGGMVKYMPISMVRVVEEYFENVTTSLAKKKARLIYGIVKEFSGENSFPISFKLGEETVLSYPGTFSFNRLDIGTEFLLPHIPSGITGNIIDLGCASGVLGLTAKKRNPESLVYLTDESYLARISAELTFKKNKMEGNFIVGDKLGEFTKDFAELIICNPPFHSNTRVVTDIANEMFRESKRVLKRGGRLLVVANRHLGYHKSLRAIFHNLKIVDKNSKFNIYSSYK